MTATKVDEGSDGDSSSDDDSEHVWFDLADEFA
jgi:hypothetical protein